MSTTTDGSVKCYSPLGAVGNTRTSCEYHPDPLPRHPAVERVFTIAPKQEDGRERYATVSAHWGTDYGFCTMCGHGFSIETGYEEMGVCYRCAGDITKAFHEKAYGEPHPHLDSQRYAEHKERQRKHFAHLKTKKSISPKMRLKVFERDEYKCCHCGTSKDLRVDHIHPESKGGEHAIENFQTLCARCNSKKGDRIQQIAVQS